MKTNRLWGWIKQGGAGAPSPEELTAALRCQGVSSEALEKAGQRRLALDTRLVSALVEQGTIDEPKGLEALSRCAGLPGVCLRRSLIDLGVNPLPEALARDWAVLPVAIDTDGSVAVACADHPAEEVVQELELRLGHPIRLHVALQYYLRRAIVASYQLKRDCRGAAFLLGDEVASAPEAPRPAGRAPLVVPEIALPALGGPETTSAAERRRALVGVRDEGQCRTIDGRLHDLGFETTLVRDGLAALRHVAAEPPQLIILDAHLPGRSTADLFRRMHGGERYRSCVKVLLVPARLGTTLPGLANIHRLSVLAAEGADVAEAIAAIAAGVTEDTRADRESLVRRASAAHLRGLALRADSDLDGAVRELSFALGVDSLRGETLRGIADLHYAQGRPFDALEAYGLLFDLGAARVEDVARLAELVQKRGELRRAQLLWSQAARLATDEDDAKAMRAHAAVLGRGGTEAAGERGVH